MIAIILEGAAEYVSPVFAIKKAGWGSEVLALNQERTHIERVRMWYPCRKVFIIDWEEFGYKESMWEGYDWVLKDKNLWKALRFGKRANVEDFPRFKEYTKEIILPEWFEVNDERNIQSLMYVSMGFHDSILMRIDTSKNDTEIEFNTNWGCIITVKFEGVRACELVDRIGLIYDSTLEKTDSGYTWKVTCFDAGKVGGIVDFAVISGEPFIVCDKIEWNIKIGKSEYCVKSKEYDGLYELYSDLKTVSENIFLKGDELILHHKNDTLAIEEGSKGYITYRNGKKEKGECEDQDIFEYAVDFLTQVSPEDIREEALADVISIQSLYVCHYLKYALIFSVLWSAFGLLLVFLGNMHWILCAVFFFAISLLILIGFLCAFIREKERRYIVTRTTIYYFHGNSLHRALNISQIKTVKMYCSLINKGVGTIKIKQKGAITFGYGLIAVNDVEKVYNLIRQKLAL